MKKISILCEECKTHFIVVHVEDSTYLDDPCKCGVAAFTNASKKSNRFDFPSVNKKPYKGKIKC